MPATYYDMVLFLIPVLFTVMIGGSLLANQPVTVGVSAGGVAGVLLVGHAMFVRSPAHALSQ